MSDVIRGLSSMATRLLVADLAEEIGRRHGILVSFTSAGGVEVARAVREGAQADVLVLGSAAMEPLGSQGLLVPGTMRPLFVSEVVAAVPAGAMAGPLAGPDDLRDLLLAAGRIAYSTGPSGTGLLELLERWALLGSLRDRLVQAPAGVPVGSLLARGEADLGFQQRSELMDVSGVRPARPAARRGGPLHHVRGRRADRLCPARAGTTRADSPRGRGDGPDRGGPRHGARVLIPSPGPGPEPTPWSLGTSAEEPVDNRGAGLRGLPALSRRVDD